MNRIVSLIIGLSLAVNVFSQAPHLNAKYGADSASRVDCAKNLSTMNEFVKIKLYDRAWDSWMLAYKNCPASSKNIYIHGVKIIKNRIDNTTDANVKNGYIDSLMVLYDNRIKYFGEEGFVLGKKGVDLLKYNQPQAFEAYGYLSKSVKLEGVKSDESVIVTLMQAAYLSYKAKQLESAQMVLDYIMLSELTAKMTQSGKASDDLTKAQEAIDKLFAESGVADCQTLAGIFQPKFDAAPTDVDLLKKIVQLMSKSNCDQLPLYAQASEALYKVEPGAQSAYYLARLFYKKEEHAKSADYYNKAIELETSDSMKAVYYYQLGVVQQVLGQLAASRSSARSALQLLPNWGDPYILIGNLYASSARTCGDDNFKQSAVYLIAVDQYQKAKSVDTSVTNTAQELINRYSGYFPNNEDAFFNGYTDGKPFTIGCWIGETTTIRTVKR